MAFAVRLFEDKDFKGTSAFVRVDDPKVIYNRRIEVRICSF